MTAGTFGRAGMLGGIEEVLLGSPDDLCLHQAYATALLAQGDAASAARARFIQTQLKLEEGRLGEEERRKLAARERKLLRAHGEAWLADLAGWLTGPTYGFTMWRGWLESVEAPELNAEFLRALARAPIARLLRRLALAHDRPGGAAALAPLLDSPALTTLREFRLGEHGIGEAPAMVLRRLAEGG